MFLRVKSCRFSIYGLRKDAYLLVTNKKELPTTKQDHTHFTVSDNQVTEVTINQGVLSKKAPLTSR